ncbi:MAG TPA: hypothetical protein VIW29_16825 [Polyangiaceae bacterium]
MKKSALFCLLAATFASQSLVSCTEVGIVGGRCGQQQVVLEGSCLEECPEELTACDQQCVDLSDNEDHCGSCGNACGAQESCQAGECVFTGSGGSAGAGGSSGTAGSAGEGGSEAGGAGEGQGGAGQGNGGSAGAAGSSAGQGQGGAMPPVCGPPFNTPDKCGSCDVQCPGTEVCSPVGGGYECVPACEPAADLCEGACTDTEVDPDNCGECGTVCESGYCYMGECVGGHYGHVVLMCIDYTETARSSPTQWLLGNSVFLPANRVARVLAFDGFTPAALRDNVDLTLSWAAGEVGQLYELTHEDNADDLAGLLKVENFDTLLVYSQPDAVGTELADLGASLEVPISTFVDEGGAVVVLSGGEMEDFIVAADLLDVTGETALTNVPLFNRAPTDSVGINVLSSFQPLANTCSFTTTAPQNAGQSFVIATQSPLPPPPQPVVNPVVVHKILFKETL